MRTHRRKAARVGALITTLLIALAAPVVAAFPAAAAGSATSSIELVPSVVWVEELADGGVSIYGEGYVPGEDVTILIDEEEIGTVTASDSGSVEHVLTGPLNVGTHTVTVRGATETASADLTVRQQGDDPIVSVSQDQISQWDAARGGFFVEGSLFAPETNVRLDIDGVEQPGSQKADEEGSVSIATRTELAPGPHDATLTASEGSASASFTVLSDAESSWFYGEDVTVEVVTDRLVVSPEDLAAKPVRASGFGYPEGGYIDVLIDGVFVATVESATSFDVLSGNETVYDIAGPLEVGTHTVTFQHPAGSGETEFVVASADQGALPPAGTYRGIARQTHNSSVLQDEVAERPIEFVIDDAGQLSGLRGGYYWACIDSGGFHGNGSDDFASHPLPATALTAGVPFEIVWSDDSTSNTFYGVVGADGAASGRIWVDLGVCGASIFDWTASTGAVPAPVDPAPVDPAPVDPAPVDPTPVDPAPVDPAPVDPAPVDPAPVDPAPAPVDPAPGEPAPQPDDTQLAATGGTNLIPLFTASGLVALVGAVLIRRRAH